MAAILDKMRGLAAVIGILGVALIAMTGYTIHAFHSQQERQAQIAVMTHTIEDWQEKADRLNSEKLRPVTAKQAQEVKKRIIFAAQGNQLNLLGSSDHAEANGRLCELDVSGDWGNIVNFLKNFGSGDALVGIKGLAMNMEKGKIQAHVVYEIYTKDGVVSER